MKENWVVISPSRDKQKNDIKWFYPEDEYTLKIFLAILYTYGLGNLLDNVCEIIKENNCIVFSFDFIAVSKGDKTLKSFWHEDYSNGLDDMYIIIIPVDIPTTVELQLLLKDVGDKKDRGTELREGCYCYRKIFLWPLVEELNMLHKGVVMQVTRALCLHSLPVKFQQNQ